MQNTIFKLQKLFERRQIELINKGLQEILYKFSILFFSDIVQFKKEIVRRYDKTKIYIIDEFTEENCNFFIICFDYTLNIIQLNNETDISFIYDIFNKNAHSEKYFLKSNKEDKCFISEIQRFSNEFYVKNSYFRGILNIVSNCICGFLIKTAYQNARNHKDDFEIKNFNELQEKEKNPSKPFIVLRQLGHGSGGFVMLIYYIPHESIYALKIQTDNNYELNERERNNYLRIRYPYIVPYYGYVENDGKKCLLLKYIEGKSLNKYDISKLSIHEKYNIIFEIMLTVRYIHSLEFICRDLSFDNIIINENKDAILIDFDRVVKINDQKTTDFGKNEISPEKYKTYKSDIYSLGCIIKYILFGKIPSSNYQKQIIQLDEDISSIYDSCLSIDPNLRPNMSELIHIFHIVNIQSEYFKGTKEQNLVNLFEKTILKNDEYNDYYTLGLIYSDNKYVRCNINKGINYLSISAKQNNPGALFTLGAIFLCGQDVTQDINKALHYLLLAANQNHQNAYLNINAISLGALDATREFNRTNLFFMLERINNSSMAQYHLGLIYLDDKYDTFNIDKAIRYLELAANQNNSDAQFKLGLLYYEGKYITQNINKAFSLFSFAANKNNSDAQYIIGCIYEKGVYLKYDIEKAIHYYTLAANQNNEKAQMVLGIIYYAGLKVTQDINLSFHYFSLAAAQNNRDAQFILGCFYFTPE